MSAQRFVLAEIIKLSQLDVGVIVDFIKSHGIQPDWLHMQLPGGRHYSSAVLSEYRTQRKVPNLGAQAAA